MAFSRSDRDMRSVTLSPSESFSAVDRTPTSGLSSSTVVSQPTVSHRVQSHAPPNMTTVGPDGRPPSRIERGEDGSMYLVWEPGVTETTTTHVTRTITTFPPLRLPAPLPASTSNPLGYPQIPLPTHLSPSLYPLALEPTPDDLRSFSMNLGGKKVVFTDRGLNEEDFLGERKERVGPGWRKMKSSASGSEIAWQGLRRVDLGEVLGSMEAKDSSRWKGKSRQTEPLEDLSLRSPTSSNRHTSSLGSSTFFGNEGTTRSPPRKRLRDASIGGGIPSPSPMMDDDVTRSPIATTMTATAASRTHDVPLDPHQPSIGSGAEITTLHSLPALLAQFDHLPPKIKEHFLIQCLRRTTRPSIQRVSQFISPALKFDFVSLFPAEISIAIFTFLDRPGLAAAIRVSRKWSEMIDSQRSIWAGRLKSEGFWYGFGAEEEEEDLIRRRWEVMDEREERARKSGSGRSLGTPGEVPADPFDGSSPRTRTRDEDRPDSNEACASSDVKMGADEGDDDRLGTATISRKFEEPGKEGEREADLGKKRRRSHPLKQVYRLRQQQKANWSRRKPRGGRFMFHGHGSYVVTCLQFDNDKIVSASDDHSINIYSIKDGSLRCRLDGHEGGVWALQYKADVLVSGSTDRTVRIWSIKRHEQTHIFHGHTSTVRCLQIVEPVKQPNGEFLPPYPLIVTGSRDNTLRVWRLPRDGEPEYKSNKNPYRKKTEGVNPEENPFHNHLLEGHTHAVRAIAAHGRYCVSGSYDCTVRVWDIVKGTCLYTLRGHAQKVYSVVLDTGRNRVASGSMDGTVKVWDLITGKCLATLEGHSSLVGLLGISPNHLVSAAADSTIKVWDAATLECQHTLKGHQGAITCFQHDETKIISGSEGTLKMWDIKDGTFVQDLVTGVQGVWRVSFSNRYVVSASNRTGLTVFDVIDFGDSGYDDGAGDETLDEFIIPEWERANRLEPRTYQTNESTTESGGLVTHSLSSVYPSNPLFGNTKDLTRVHLPTTPTKIHLRKIRTTQLNPSSTAPTTATTVGNPSASDTFANASHQVETPSQPLQNQLPGASPVTVVHPTDTAFPNAYSDTAGASSTMSNWLLGTANSGIGNGPHTHTSSFRRHPHSHYPHHQPSQGSVWATGADSAGDPPETVWEDDDDVASTEMEEDN
ncbi:Cdc4 and related F-box and WD-40 proteins [Phaffia rhodozyma]|uniref:Cdc4 and related F-box and WD-40 proteins n=1 Tax=Phaffia rhodozyma TaxID=264483 RepID=A0A0F7SV92_PHARH|nr:Cdc4 and related F-box and WD-40 proteins [Phaffia rhodozyma]